MPKQPPAAKKEDDFDPTVPRTSTRLVSLVFVIVRVPLVLLLLPFSALAAAMKMVGEIGEWLGDSCRDVARSITVALNPRAWDMLRDMKEERDMYERDMNFWKAQAALSNPECAKVRPPL